MAGTPTSDEISAYTAQFVDAAQSHGHRSAEDIAQRIAYLGAVIDAYAVSVPPERGALIRLVCGVARDKTTSTAVLAHCPDALALAHRDDRANGSEHVYLIDAANALVSAEIVLRLGEQNGSFAAAWADEAAESINTWCSHNGRPEVDEW